MANVLYSLGELGVELKDKWVADTGASAHMCNKLEWFSEYKAYEKPMSVSVGDGHLVKILGKGKVKIVTCVGKQRITGTLVDVAYIPVLATNLLSIGASANQGITATFEKNASTLRKMGQTVARGDRLVDNLYLLDIEVVTEKTLIIQKSRSLEE